MRLEKRLHVKTAELTSLQKKVSDIMIDPPGHTPNSTHSYSYSLTHRVATLIPNHLNDSSRLKENIIPQ